MKINSILFLSFIILFSNLSNCYAQCASASNIYAFSYGGKNYELVKEKKTWADAAACAVARGGYLAHVESNNESLALYFAALNAGVSTTYASSPDGGGIAYIWIGATDKFTEGTWVWAGNNINTNNVFWTGQGAYGHNDGVAVSGRFNKWGKNGGIQNEPDDFNHEQDAGAIALATWPFCAPSCQPSIGTAGEWNDISATNQMYFFIQLSPIIPIELVDFTAKTLENKGVLLEWTTATEKSNKGFEIETSLDGATWTVLSWVNGQGNSEKLTKYSFLHQTSLDETNYYRLKQVDDDGKAKYSKTVSSVPSKIKTIIKIYPSVVQDVLTVESSLNAIEEVQIINSGGQIVFERKLNNKGETLNLNNLPSGIYVVNVLSNGEKFSQKILKP